MPQTSDAVSPALPTAASTATAGTGARTRRRPHLGEKGRHRARLIAGAYLAVVLVAVTWPSGSDVAGAKSLLGLWFLTPEQKDVTLNLVMVAPLTLLATLGWPRVPWWAWALMGCGLGCGAELTQHLLPALGRRASWWNVLENGAGAWAGAVVAELAVRWALRDRA
ncbi:VanZ family protein [Actinomyces radicidentis]|uniref:VanZ family protein n=1 Tax=Actinomyces radicidentis TaxID=111015 RepID=UPI000B340AFF|nr:VanZ family protein [Actinomyces radicidentis]